jgi:GNAT superfamily N-acetyltransferase
MTDSFAAARMQTALVAAFSAVYEGLAGARVEPRPGYILLVCPPVPLLQFNGVWAERDGGDAVADLGTALAEVERLGLPFWLQTREGRHPLVEHEARRLGLGLAEQFPGMVAAASDLTSLPASGIGIERVADASRLASAAQVAEAGFEAPPGTLAALYSERLAATQSISYHLGYAGADPVSTAMSLVRADTVGIFNVATLPRCRGRGYGTALSAHAVQEGLERGAQLAWLQASPLSEPVYRRMGFRPVETYNLFTRG